MNHSPFFDEGLVDVADPYSEPVFLRSTYPVVGRGIVVFNLHFESCGRKPRGLKSGMKIDAGVGTGHGLDFDSKLEIAEIGAVDGPGVEEMGTFAVGDDLAINDLECALMLAGLPAVERFAIEKWDPIGLGSCAQARGGCGCGEQHGEDFAARKFGHWVSG